MAACEITFDPIRIDFAAAAKLMLQNYWAVGRSEDEQIKAFSNSLCAAAMLDGRQVGFGRVITDRVFMAHLCDVIVWPDCRGQGIGSQLIRAFLGHEELRTVRRWSLNTSNAHAVYERFGFTRSADGNHMQFDRQPKA